MASPALDTRAYRDLIGHFATGVTVVTVKHGTEVRAMTANAVSSVSLEPLLVLVCVERSASIHDQLRDRGAFALNILSEGQRELSQLFARHGELQEPLGGVPHRFGETGNPLLEGALAHVECELWREYEGGDHTIFVGRVVDMHLGEPGGEPLLFYAGQYRALGDEQS